jgi:flagellar hook assembly protein FlgD
LRRPALSVALAFALVAVLSPALAVPTRAATGPKVAIIVGATHGATSQYRTYANQVYAEAIKYTPNVVRVYSPNATWTAVKSAVNGASIIVYLGHGNGWPSPYTYDPAYTTKNGFGLNATAGAGDNNVKYYGEPSVRTLTPAPNAVVILMHLCYASGNSEPGQTAPSLTTARQRVDNYGAGFLRSNVRAVIADGHAWDHGYYIRALFTTRQTIDEVWRNAPNFHDNVLTYASSRTPGMTYQMDPDNPTSGYYRSIVGKMSLTTQQVTGAAYAATDTDPATFVVPGAASAKVEGAPVYADAAAVTGGADPIATLPLDTRVRVDQNLGSVGGGPQALAVHTLDGATSGVMRAADLTPRDSQGPRVWDAEAGTGAFSPNGDGSQDGYHLEVALSESAAWTLRIRDGDTTLAAASGTSGTATIDWDGRRDGSAVDDGTYAWDLEAADGWGNAPLADDGQLQVDTVAPTLDGAGLAAAESEPLLTFSPNGDGQRDTMSVGVGADEPSTIEAAIRTGGGTHVADIGAAAPSGAATLTWDGRTVAGALAADGVYTLGVAARDAAGNRSPEATYTIGVHKALARARTSTINFFPNDNDTYGNSLTLAFDLLAQQTVTWRVVDANGTTVRVLKQDAVLNAGTHTLAWNGKTEAGTYLPRGLYRHIVTATNGMLTSTLTAPFVQDMFKFSVSDSTPARGQALTVTIVSAEPLSKAPRLTISQPGVSAWSVTFSYVTGRTYKATIRLKSGSTGTLQLRASGYDTKNDYESSLLKLPLH